MTNETMQELTPEQLHQTIEEYLVSLVSSEIREMAYEKLESDYQRFPDMAVVDYNHNLERINALIESGHFS